MSITEELSSNGTVFNLKLTPDSISPGSLSIGLSEGSIGDANGVTNPPVQSGFSTTSCSSLIYSLVGTESLIFIELI